MNEENFDYSTLAVFNISSSSVLLGEPNVDFPSEIKKGVIFIERKAAKYFSR